ncbi:MauE/DoxX family redox-associated membrane protein [Cohnella sp. GCM10020058]|uniref:MauE/DoxX family redox-associated membrane protein n=1 Tax=Cohnella sp. GCM10020058 TaxID=3317330 RepID=UPI003629F5CA
MPEFAIVLLCSIFGLSAAAKATDQRAFRATLGELGLTGAIAATAAVAVPALEFAGAALLLPAVTRPFGAFLLLALLAAFGGAAWLARGRHIDCGCFGSVLQEELGAGTYGRIAVCAALAVYALLEADGRSLLALAALDLACLALASAGLLAAYTLLSSIARHRKSGLTL